MSGIAMWVLKTVGCIAYLVAVCAGACWVVKVNQDAYEHRLLKGCVGLHGRFDVSHPKASL